MEPAVDLDDDDANWNPDGSSIELARAKANENLAAALIGLGWSAEGARILARACARPDDVRRRLSAPVELRVPGGTMLVVESTVFSHGVTTYPTNLRELGARLYPLGITGDSAEDKPITDPVADPEHPSELLLEAGDRSQLSERLRSSETWLHQHNPLADEVGLEGVLQPVTLAGMRVDHRDGAPSVHLLVAVDGSSRTTAVHRLLGADSADLVYGKGSSEGNCVRKSAMSCGRFTSADGQGSQKTSAVRSGRSPCRPVSSWATGRSLAAASASTRRSVP